MQNHDEVYCYPGSDVLINKLGLGDAKELAYAEKRLTSLRIAELSEKPIRGKFDFQHLKRIHKYLFQDLYSWAGKVRTVEIGKGNLFCTTPCIAAYADSIFAKYFPQCWEAKDDEAKFVHVLAENYGDLNALHPFREGNGRAQREFARCVCLKCGYAFDLACTVHREMLEASIYSFNEGDNSYLERIFSRAISMGKMADRSNKGLGILTADDLVVDPFGGYEYYRYEDRNDFNKYDEMYREKIRKMDAKNQGNRC